MTKHNESPAAVRAHRSEFDRHAINVAGHLLFGIVWLERRIASVPDQIGSPVTTSRRSEPLRQLPPPIRAGGTGVASRATAGIGLGTNDPVETKEERKD
jgi:hypothetical protein